MALLSTDSGAEEHPIWLLLDNGWPVIIDDWSWSFEATKEEDTADIWCLMGREDRESA